MKIVLDKDDQNSLTILFTDIPRLSPYSQLMYSNTQGVTRNLLYAPLGMTFVASELTLCSLRNDFCSFGVLLRGNIPLDDMSTILLHETIIQSFVNCHSYKKNKTTKKIKMHQRQDILQQMCLDSGTVLLTVRASDSSRKLRYC